MSNSDAADVLLEYSMLKMSDGLMLGQKLQALITVGSSNVSSAECERGFSQMNLCHTSGRNRLLVSSVNDLLMIGINGPPLTAWNVEKYVISCLKAGRHGALDKATGLPKKKKLQNIVQKYFCKLPGIQCKNLCIMVCVIELLSKNQVFCLCDHAWAVLGVL